MGCELLCVEPDTIPHHHHLPVHKEDTIRGSLYAELLLKRNETASALVCRYNFYRCIIYTMNRITHNPRLEWSMRKRQNCKHPVQQVFTFLKMDHFLVFCIPPLKRFPAYGASTIPTITSISNAATVQMGTRTNLFVFHFQTASKHFSSPLSCHRWYISISFIPQASSITTILFIVQHHFVVPS